MAHVLRFTSKIGHFEINKFENGEFQKRLFRKIGHSEKWVTSGPNIRILEMIDFQMTLFRRCRFSDWTISK